VVLEDPAGKTLFVWESLSSLTPLPPIPGPAKDREGYVHLDRRFAEPQLDAAFSRALAALRKRDWRTAAEQFKAILKAHPRHPLVLVLLASCWERQPNVASREEFVDWLREAASNPAAGAARFIAQSSFPSLRPDELYEILGRQPVAARSGADLEQLARAALAANRMQDALGHAEAALKKSQDTPEALRGERLRIEILLRLGQRDKAAREAQSVVSRPETPPAETAELAILLARHGMNQVADSFFKKALADKDLAGPARGVLLLRRAEVQTGLARWRSLLAAAQIVPSTTPEWSRHFEQLLGELSAPADAQAAAILAAETKDTQLRSRLLMRQAELAIDAQLAADLAWQVHQMEKLPADQIAWACGLWNAARQSGRTIEVLENRLRRGKALDQEELKELATAYRQSSRPIDAQRADTTPPPAPPQPPGQAQPMPGGSGMGGIGGQGMF
jgi:tetratricopeptide (TPR) repeat protein